ncbi:BMP family ABC transporter substrate-binding protein [Arthrobacter sp. MYb23]|uniref:BMP family lipoprotein n=1 Tax=unclassified Arthrobacter TaxID=235627 RepID=UPI000CFDE8CD|nr:MULTISPECIES: BMP family ABC transporter substrate-binding protein [unclassified Arthrobacter]PRB38482.1 BMP family ABC transporter substrate-binding protein [Arthrobacter sp. MYb51]PRB91489.1 BMP family ABC transporter substrate-binding protein [Arthrobacter sp. MYb23]
MKKPLRDVPSRGSLGGVAAVSVVAALVLAGCGSAPATTSGTAAASDYTGCIVSDTSGFDDQSFNQSSFEGLQKAEKDLGFILKSAESKANSDYETNLNGMLSAGCNLTVTVGFLLGDATKAAAEKNPDKHFAIVDYSYETPIANVKPIVYNTAEAAYLAGYAAAASSKSGKVGTFGGIKIPPVTLFMDGFYDGVQAYNKAKNKSVQVVGWDKNTQDGSFTGDFEKQDTGKQVTINLLDQGADIIMPVAGPVGKGAGAALKEAKAAGKDVKLIWVDSDGYLTAPEYKDLMFTSVMKQMGQAVASVASDDKGGKFSNEAYVGTLKNDGVAIAPFHDFDSAVPAETKSELNALKADIISGKLVVSSQASPKK